MKVILVVRLKFIKMENVKKNLVVSGIDVNLYNELMEISKKEVGKKKVLKKGFNSYFRNVLKDGVKLSKEDLIKRVVLECFEDRLNLELNVENFKSKIKERRGLEISISNSVDSNKSYSDLNNRGYYLEGLRLLKDSSNNYYIEVCK